MVPLRIGRLYEEGTIKAGNAWTDDFPGRATLSPAALRSGGYEMRWWAPNNDDIVADVFAFATAAQAQQFLSLADRPRCHDDAREKAAPWPAQAHNLRWINPDGFAQADVFLARDTRVFRVVDVPSGIRGANQLRINLRRAFRIVDSLACLLPDAGCSERQSVPA